MDPELDVAGEALVKRLEIAASDSGERRTPAPPDVRGTGAGPLSGMFRKPRSLERSSNERNTIVRRLVGLGAGLGHCLILLAHAAADADCAHHFAASFQGDAAGEDHHTAVVGSMDAEKLVAGLTEFG